MKQLLIRLTPVLALLCAFQAHAVVETPDPEGDKVERYRGGGVAATRDDGVVDFTVEGMDLELTDAVVSTSGEYTFVKFKGAPAQRLFLSMFKDYEATQPNQVLYFRSVTIIYGRGVVCREFSDETYSCGFRQEPLNGTTYSHGVPEPRGRGGVSN